MKFGRDVDQLVKILDKLRRVRHSILAETLQYLVPEYFLEEFVVFAQLQTHVA